MTETPTTGRTLPLPWAGVPLTCADGPQAFPACPPLCVGVVPKSDTHVGPGLPTWLGIRRPAAALRIRPRTSVWLLL